MLQNQAPESNAKSAQKCTVWRLQISNGSVKMAPHSLCLVPSMKR